MMRVPVRFALGLAVFGVSSAFAQYTTVSLQPAGFPNSEPGGAYGGVQVGAGFDFSVSPSVSHAGYWTGSAGSFTDLHPGSPLDGISHARGIWGSQIVGYGGNSGTGGLNHAYLWDMATNTFTDLNPAGSDESIANAIHGSIQGGRAMVGLNSHAALWSGTAASFLDLNPTGANSSEIWAVGATTQGGYVNFGGFDQAALWSGSSASYVDLHPATYTKSVVTAIDGDLQGGSGYGVDTGLETQALLWNGTAASFQNLNPTSLIESEIITGSEIRGMANGIQVGTASSDSNIHAFLWHGSASDTLDLHQFLSSDYAQSTATAVDPITGDILGLAYNQTLNRYEAVLWRPVPEPASCAALLLGTAALLRRRRRK